MLPESPFWRGCIAAAVAATLAAIGFPFAFVLTHGARPDAWPGTLYVNPTSWFEALERGDLLPLLTTYWQMGHGTCDALPGGGFPTGVTLVIVAIFSGVALMMKSSHVPLRHSSNAYGSTDWASRKERSKLLRGLEIGLDPEDSRPVRIKVEKNLLTIAPPRTGKTAGFIIPNLAVPDETAWQGPAVVIDPKGDAFRAVQQRRMALGKTVRCLDPLGIAGGADRWNPLLSRGSVDVLYLQSMARALLPNITNTSESGTFFTTTAVDLLVGALVATIENGRATPKAAASLLQRTDELATLLRKRSDEASLAALAILDGDPKLRSNVEATVRQATQWLRDPRMQHVVDGHTFELSDLAQGDVDLFIVLPADDRKKTIAPFIRWLLADLFTMAREHRLKQRLVVFVDEANVLGSFDSLLNGQGDLPGFGISLWTIWQTRSQLSDTYGNDGARTFLGNAEMVNVFDIPRQDNEETEYWSRSIGEFTAIKTTTSHDAQTGRPTTTTTAEAQRLVPATDLPNFLQHSQVAFLSGRGYTRNPIKLRRTRAFEDPRFSGLIGDTPPVGAGQ